MSARKPKVYGKWVWSLDGEWYGSDQFDAKDDAIADAVAQFAKDGASIYLGQTRDVAELGADADPSWSFHVVDAEVVNIPEGEAFEVACGFGCGAKTECIQVKGGGIWTPPGWSLVADQACCFKEEHWAEVGEGKP